MTGRFQKLVVALLLVAMGAGCASTRMTHGVGPEGATTGAGAIHDPGTSVSTGSDAAVDDAAATMEVASEERIVLEGPMPQLSAREQRALAVSTELFGADTAEDEHIKRYLYLYAEKNRSTFAAWLRRAQPYLPVLRERFRAAGLPEDLIYLPLAESGFDPRATSPAGAAGVWQFMPDTARTFGLRVDWWVDERRDIFRSTDAAIAYLKRLHAQFGDWKLALAAYNAGAGAIDRAMKGSGEESFDGLAETASLAQETRNYVPKFAAIVKMVHSLEELGFPALRWDRQPAVVPIAVQGATDLRELARAVGLPWEEFQTLNAQYRRQATPPHGTSTVLVPVTYAAAARQYLDRRPAVAMVAGLSPYTVRKGDTWEALAKRHGVPQKELLAINAGVRLAPGQTVYLPARKAAPVAAKKVEPAKEARRANYAVRPGDTVWSIARKFGVPPDAILRANNLPPSPALRPGQGLLIPEAPVQVAKTEPVRHVVQPGDTVWSIARRFGVAPEDVLRWNRLQSASSLKPGDTVVVQAP